MTDSLQPAMPPTRPRSLTRDEMIRSSAVSAASRLAAGATGLTQEEFWGNVHAIEHYIREGR
jgi:hypothetical protein